MTQLSGAHAARTPRLFYGWVIVANGFFVEMIVMGTALYAYGVFALPLSREFGTGMFAAMLGLSGLNIAVAVLSPLAGHLVASGSIRRYMVLGLALIGAGFLCTSQASALWQIVAIYALLIGFGYAFVAPIAVSAAIANWFTASRGRALSTAAIGTSFGGFVFPPLAAYVIEAHGWRAAYLLFALLFFLVAIPIVWWLVVDRPAQKGLRPYGADAQQPADGAMSWDVDALTAESQAVPQTTQTILRRREFWLTAFAMGGGFAVFMGVTANIVPYATTLGFEETRAALFLSGLTVCAMIGKVGFALITDRIGLRNTFWVAIGLQLLAMILLVFVPTFATLFVATACVGLSSGGLLPSWPGFIAALFGREALPKVMGLSAPIVNGSMMVSPAFAGLAFDLSGDYRPAFLVFAIVLVLAGLASRTLHRR